MDEVVLEKINTFFVQFKHQVYKKGEILIRSDDTPSGVFYLKEGSVKKYAISKRGDELVVNIFKPVSFFPMSWAVNSSPNEYYYEALTDADVWRAPQHEVRQFIKNNPDVLYDLLQRVYKGTDGLLRRMTYLMSGDAYERLLIELIIHAKRFGKDIKPVELTITEKDLSVQAGLTRETVSREMKNLKEKKLIFMENHKIFLKDISKLEAELAEID